VAEADLLRAFRFRVSLFRSGEGEGPDRLGDGGFAECTGLEVAVDVQDYLEGGRNDTVVRRVGRARYQPLVLRRGMLASAGGPADRQLWQWVQGVVAGVRPVARYDGTVEVLDPLAEPVAVWSFRRGLPARIAGPQLNARTGEVAMEELHIAHEGLALVEA
jgi:phage tail-like protein